MLLREIQIENFRGISKIYLKIDPVTVIIGENNTGKTSILEALKFCLGRSLLRKDSMFSEYDYHFSGSNIEPSQAEPISITLNFAEQIKDEWTDTTVQLLSDVIQINDNGLQSLNLRVTSKYDTEQSNFITSWDFIDNSKEVLIKAKNPKNLITIQQLIPVFYLTALRDAAQEFRPKSQFWAPFVQNTKIAEDLRVDLEEQLSNMNQKVLDAHKAFDNVKVRLRETSKLVPLDKDDPVSIEAIPKKMFDMLSRTQVLLTSKAGAKLPIGRHGEGTQSLAVMLLFDAFLQHQLENEYDASTEPILALEEPEAHLHPSAVRSVAKLLQELKGQKIIATHSRELISSVELYSLRRLCRKDGVIKVFQLEPGVLTEDELNKLNYCVRATRADLLLARCWLMVEGATEYIVFNESARILGIDLYAEGICCVEYAQSSPDALLKFANAMGIDWHFQADGDTEGINYLKKAEEHLMGRSKDMHLSKLEYENMEIFLCINDYGYVFEDNISPQKRDKIDCCKGTKEYWQQVVKARTQIFTKTRAAITVMQEIENQGANALPQQIKTIIENVRDIARQAG